jgi:hypothetical protein
MRSILILILVDSWTSSQPQLVDAMSEADTPYLTPYNLCNDDEGHDITAWTKCRDYTGL